MQSLVGQSLGRYHLIEQLGEGGMATVYRGFDTRLERPVAVKVIRTDIGQEPEFLKRFEREARALAKLNHPHIVHVLDAGDHDGIPYVVMDYLAGGTLKALTGRALAADRAARLLAPIARALEYAHSQGIVHRDVKPANILLTPDGQPMLSDFGIAKVLTAPGATELTAAGVGVGTPDYMAPEQWAGQPTPASDIYALGVVFYELLTGRRPYVADTPMAVLLKHVSDPLPNPRQFVPGLPAVAEQVLYKALAKKAEDRYASMSEFAAALERLRQTAPSSQQRPAWAWPVGLSAAALLACGLVLGAGWVIWRMAGGALPSATPKAAVAAPATAESTMIPVIVPSLTSARTATVQVALATAAPLAAASSTPAADATARGGGGLIAFYSDLAGSNDLYVMNPDGSDVRQLTFDDADSRLPAWSRDGQMLAYQSSLNGVVQIMALTVATGQTQQVTTDACNHYNPVWSGRGRIAYYSDCDGNREIYSMRADGSGVAQLTFTTDAYNWFPFWSPDDSRLTFSSNREGARYQIFVMNADGSSPVPLARGCVSAFSPDGGQIVFSSYCDGTGDILVMNADGGNIRNLTNGVGENANATWSRDGSRIVFQSRRDGATNLYAMDVDGSRLEALTSGSGLKAAPVWQP